MNFSFNSANATHFLQPLSPLHTAQIPDFAQPHFYLRAIQKDDLQDWFLSLSSSKVADCISWRPKSPDDLQQFIEENNAPNASELKFAIADTQSKRMIGSIGFHTISVQDKKAEIAYDLAPEYWGKGIASIACASMCQWAFEHGQLRRIQATVLESNLRSAAVLERNGFIREGLMQHYKVIDGQPRNFYLFSKTN